MFYWFIVVGNIIYRQAKTNIVAFRQETRIKRKRSESMQSDDNTNLDRIDWYQFGLNNVSRICVESGSKMVQPSSLSNKSYSI